jgi:hypothetical protein
MMQILNRRIMKWVIFLFSLVIATGAACDEKSLRSFAVGQYADSETGKYANNLRLSKILTIPDAEELEVTIIGTLEKCAKHCDYLTIYDSHKKKIGRYSGVINEKLTVVGSSIRLTFKSDGRKTEKGVLVTISERLPANLFNEIKSQLLAATESILKKGTEEAYVKIAQTLRLFKTLQSKITETTDIAQKLNEATVALMGIAQTYREIAAMSKDIMATHQTQFELWGQLKNKTLYNIAKIEKKKQTYLSKLKEIETQLPNVENSLEKQKAGFSIKGYKNILQSLDAQHKIWHKFYGQQENIEGKLRSHSEKVSLFLHYLKINSQIYEESANMLLLNKSAISTLDDLTNLNELRKLIADIEESEKNIRQWLEKVKSSEL